MFRAVTDLHRFRISYNGIAQRLINILVDVHAFGGDADLAIIAKRRPEKLLRDLFNIDIGHDDSRVVAAKFKRDAFQRR